MLFFQYCHDHLQFIGPVIFLLEIFGARQHGGVLAQVDSVSGVDGGLEDMQLVKDFSLVVVLGVFFDVGVHSARKFRKIILQP